MGERRRSAWQWMLTAVTERRRAARCRASGWGVRASCTDGRGTAVCPVCSRRVRAAADDAAGIPVHVLGEHQP